MNKKFLAIVCFLYSAIIIYVWFFDKLKNYLAPNMQIYLKLSLILLLLMGLVLLVSKDSHYKFKISDLVLLLPLVLLIFAGDGRLTASFANNRLNSQAKTKNVEKQEEIISDVEVIEEEKEETEEQEETISYDFSNPDFLVVDANYYDLASYFTFIPKASKYTGKTIKVRGFTMLKDEYIPDGYFMIGKYNISCCAADAMMVGFYVKNDDSNIKNNKWYEIEGVLEPAIDTEGYDTMAIKIVNIESINSRNEEQYVYTCYTYDDNCTETMKYNLEY